MRDARATTRATSVTVRGGDGRCVGVGSIMGKGHGEEHGEGQLGTTEGKLANNDDASAQRSEAGTGPEL